MIKQEIKCDGFHFMEHEILNKLVNFQFRTSLFLSRRGDGA